MGHIQPKHIFTCKTSVTKCKDFCSPRWQVQHNKQMCPYFVYTTLSITARVLGISLPLEKEGCQWTAYTQFSWPANTDSKVIAYVVSVSTTNQRKAHFFLKAKKKNRPFLISSVINQLLSSFITISIAYWHWKDPWKRTLLQALHITLTVTEHLLPCSGITELLESSQGILK